MMDQRQFNTIAPTLDTTWPIDFAFSFRLER